MTASKNKQWTHKTITTVGFCPSWDITCRVDGITWGEHKKIASQSAVPAGKSLNISKAMNWMGIPSTAAGLWGHADYAEMADILHTQYPLIRLGVTTAAGKTRHNTTLIDTRHRREMHLRADCRLATPQSLRRLQKDLDPIAAQAGVIVFAGSMPIDYLDECTAVIKRCRSKGAAIAVDTSGPALTKAVSLGGLTLIKPNLEELSELLGKSIRNQPGAIIKAARTLCDQTQIVVVSRGKDGAIAVTRNQAIGGCVTGKVRDIVNTVGCGDYLLAGFLSKIHTGNLELALSAGVQAATARASGLSDTTRWNATARAISVQLYQP